MTITNIALITTLSIISSVCYRLGGAGTPPFHRWWRRVGSSILNTAILSTLFGYSPKFLIAYFITFGLFFGSYSTYFKWGKVSDVSSVSWLLTAIAYSLAPIIVIGLSGHWIGFLVRSFVLCLFIPLASKWNNVILEELFVRGLLVSATLAVLLI